MTVSYKFQGQTYAEDAPNFAAFLSHAYGNSERPRCACRPGGIEMYVAKVGGIHVIKRMPNTGSLHSPSCNSYEPPPETSGLAEVNGSAIQTDVKTGITTLKFDFALSKAGSRIAPPGGGEEKSTVKSDGKKLTLRGALHYLMDEAGFTRWSPAMAGKRNWYVFRKYLLQAANDKAVKGNSLAANLFMPESFSVERKAELEQRRSEVFNQLRVTEKSTRKLMILVAEVKEILPARIGKKLIVKHLPDSFFMIDDGLHKKLAKRFSAELGLWDALEGTHLLVIATFGVADTGIASIEEASLVLTNENWIPFETTDEKELIDALAARRFVKSLRYNMPTTKPIASAVLSDTETPVAMYIVPANATEEFETEFVALQDESQLDSWTWNIAEGPMPDLPPAQDSRMREAPPPSADSH
ncbi:DUF1173 domain-containing protein [Burkholderia vietnamiensis]|uniref:DUF1173 domain-containing protein n=1 Tax=Burkholderia vietnamiensis TaxID=60552 RepID=UPI001594692A|nr:DUF1173 domain-containing protein [Burkholderia vietnamiensis]